MFQRLMEAGLIIAAGVVLFGRGRLFGTVRDVKKSGRILKSEMQASADDVDLPEPKVVRGRVVDRD